MLTLTLSLTLKLTNLNYTTPYKAWVRNPTWCDLTQAKLLDNRNIYLPPFIFCLRLCIYPKVLCPCFLSPCFHPFFSSCSFLSFCACFTTALVPCFCPYFCACFYLSVCLPVHLSEYLSLCASSCVSLSLASCHCLPFSIMYPM